MNIKENPGSDATGPSPPPRTAQRTALTMHDQHQHDGDDDDDDGDDASWAAPACKPCRYLRKFAEPDLSAADDIQRNTDRFVQKAMRCSQHSRLLRCVSFS